MARVAWASVAILLVLGFLGSLTSIAWGGGSSDTVQAFETTFLVLGWVGVGGSLLVGALGLWARAPATLATALGIVGAGAFTCAWLTQFVEAGDDAGLHLGMVVAYSAILVAFAASLRRPS